MKQMRRIILFLAGCFLLGTGIGVCNAGGWGMDALDVLTTGLAGKIGLALSLMNFAVYLVMSGAALILDKKQVAIWTFAAPFVTSLGIDLSMRVLTVLRLNAFSLGVYMAGILVMGFGNALSIYANCGRSPYDAFLYALMTHTKKSYAVIRWIFDGSCILLGLILGGFLGIGTVIAFLVIGKLIEFFIGLFDRIAAHNDKSQVVFS